VAVEGGQRRSQFGWGLGLVGGQQRAKQPVVDLGVEHRDALCVNLQ
jgi:hypothetical protein